MSGRKVLVASYHVEDIILIPKWLDLDDIAVVDSWGVKRGVLYVDFVDGRSMEFKAICNARDYDFKYPDDTQLRDPGDYGFGEEDFDDEEQEEEKDIVSISSEEQAENDKTANIYYECCDNVATETFEDVPCCTDCHKNGVEYYKSMGI